ncbi:MAG: hypothetical protein ACOYD1_07615 [Candidatus Nanopelagicales bacterium]
MRVIGIDPGQATGLVEANVTGTSVEVISTTTLSQRDTCYWLERLADVKVELVVCERWIPRGGPQTFKPFSLELIGFVRGMCWLHGVPLVLQDAAVKNVFHGATFGVVNRGCGDHVRDAVAHVIGWANMHG